MADAPPGAELTSPLTMRGIIGVLGALVLYLVVSEVLETVLVRATAETPLGDVTTYFAARNRPGVLGAKVAYNSLIALWSGYMAAKVAGEREMYYGAFAAFVATARLASVFLMGDYAAFTPAWMRAFLVLSTGPFMLAGALIRGRARVVQEASDAAARSQEPA